MKIWEVTGTQFNSPGAPPGELYSINSANNSSNVNADSNTNAGNATPVATNTSSNTANLETLPPEITQQLQKGATVTLPMGPNKQIINLKISNVGSDSDKSVTLTNPKTPNQPGQVYKYADLAKILSDKNPS